MNFENDIFISYTLASGEEEQANKVWTLKFCEYLAVLMNRLYETKPAILLHDDLRIRQTVLGENIRDAFSKTGVFVVILTPENVKSHSYLKELEEIYHVAYSSDQGEQKKYRIFKVLTQPVAAEDQPGFLRSELSYNFFEINRFSKRPITYDLNDKNGPAEKFWSKLVDLAYDIADALNDLSERNNAIHVKRDNPAVFLAETSFDQAENRDMLKRELQHLGFRVLPLVPVPDEAEQSKQAIDDCLRQSLVSVHLLGAWYGELIKNSKLSLIDFQIKTVKDFITAKNNQNKPYQVIWIPNDIKPSDQRQSLYLKRLKRDEAQYRTEIVETPFEVFKTHLNTRLNELTGFHPKPLAEKNTLYVIYEKKSGNKLAEYIKFIQDKGFTILESDKDGVDFFPLSKHINYLLTADAVLIYKGDSTMEWLNCKIRDLVKAPGYGKSSPFRAVEIISSQKTADKSLLFLKNVAVNWDEEINQNVINHFLDHLRKK